LIRPVSGLLAPESTAVAASVIAAAGGGAEVVSTGMACAMVAARWDVFDELQRYSELLEPAVRQHLAARLHERGEQDRAQALGGTPVRRSGGFRITG
ncbi:MAG: hypothetical protein KDB16_15350, partial [Acidimicrobiales bacterium]|nr:hypothetical protein [Acidimicrobiales bacterium]